MVAHPYYGCMHGLAVYRRNKRIPRASSEDHMRQTAERLSVKVLHHTRHKLDHTSRKTTSLHSQHM